MSNLTLKPLLNDGQSSRALGKLALGVAAGALAGGYGRTGFAGTCLLTMAPSTYLCSGAADPATDVTQSLNLPAQDVSIQSAPDFGLDTTANGGAGLELKVDPSTSPTNSTISVSNIQATGDALNVDAFSDTSFASPRSTITIDTAAGAIVSQAGTGIRSNSGGADIAITTADVKGEIGIAAGEPLSPSIPSYPRLISRIDSTAGTVIGTNGTGIANRGANIDITTADVKGTTDGVSAFSYTVYDQIRIDTTGGTVNGQTGHGISAIHVSYDYGGPSGTYIDIVTADVVGSKSGIRAYVGVYSGAYIDTTAGSVTATDGDGISLLGGGNQFTVTTADVTGQSDGLYIYDFGTGRQKIDTTAGTVTGETGSGIFITSFNGDIDVVTGDVVGETHGIFMGTGRISIDVQGHVSGSAGIVSGKYYGWETTVITNSGLIEGLAGPALDLGDGADQVTIREAYAGRSSAVQTGIIGTSLFGGGNDVLSLGDGDGNLLYQGVFDGLFDGGAGFDTVNFSVAVEDLALQAGSGTAIDLFFVNDTEGSATLSFLDFEAFTFADNPALVYSLNDLRNLSTPAPIPLPAGLVLLVTALGGLGLAKRQRARASC